MRNTYKILVINLKRRLVGAEGKIILKLSLEKKRAKL
jgi:hypothetical protein